MRLELNNYPVKDDYLAIDGEIIGMEYVDDSIVIHLTTMSIVIAAEEKEAIMLSGYFNAMAADKIARRRL